MGDVNATHHSSSSFSLPKIFSFNVDFCDANDGRDASNANDVDDVAFAAVAETSNGGAAKL